jgi:hypothetical protein
VIDSAYEEEEKTCWVASRRLWNLSITLWSKAYAVTAKALVMPERDVERDGDQCLKPCR